MQRKLGARGHAAGEVSAVLDRLAAENLQSDVRYTEIYLRSRAERGYGPQRIAIELRQRGASVEIIQQALNETECDWLVLARKADRKKFGDTQDGNFAVLVKRRRYLEYRGFSSDQIKAALKPEHESY